MRTLIAFLSVFLLAGCCQSQKHVQEQKSAQATKVASAPKPTDNLHMMWLDLPDYIGKKVTLQVTAYTTQWSTAEYLAVSITDRSCPPDDPIQYGIAEFDRTQFEKDRMDILGFKDTKITITGTVVEYGPTSHPGIIVTSYRLGWN